jgi:hypothetical protein
MALCISHWTFLDKKKEKALDLSRAFGLIRMVPDYQMVEVVGIEPTSEKPSI